MRFEAPTTSICLELPLGTKSDHFHFKSSRMVFLKPGCTLQLKLEGGIHDLSLGTIWRPPGARQREF